VIRLPETRREDGTLYTTCPHGRGWGQCGECRREERAPMTTAEALIELRKLDCECDDHDGAQEPRCEALDVAIRALEKAVRR
jgi:hypothetical protein